MRTLLSALLVAALFCLPGLVEAGCSDYTLCETGTVLDAPCQDSGGNDIVINVKKGGNHLIWIDKAHTDNVCTVNIYEGGDETPHKQDLIGAMSCQGTQSLNTSGPSPALVADIDGTVTGTTPGIKVMIRACD